MLVGMMSFHTGFFYIKSVSLQVLYIFWEKKKLFFQPWGSTKHNSVSSKNSSGISAVCWITQDAPTQLAVRGKARTYGVYRRIPGEQETCRVLGWWPRGAKYGTPHILKRERFPEVWNYGKGLCFTLWLACFYLVIFIHLKLRKFLYHCLSGTSFLAAQFSSSFLHL